MRGVHVCACYMCPVSRVPCPVTRVPMSHAMSFVQCRVPYPVSCVLSPVSRVPCLIVRCISFAEDPVVEAAMKALLEVKEGTELTEQLLSSHIQNARVLRKVVPRMFDVAFHKGVLVCFVCFPMSLLFLIFIWATAGRVAKRTNKQYWLDLLIRQS
jgi:hypothetical protein